MLKQFFTILVISLTVAGSAHATDSSPSSSPLNRELREGVKQQIRQEIRETKDEIKGNLEEKREEVKSRIQEFRNNVAELHANRLERRFRFYYNRLSGISQRLSSRIATLKSAGKDTSSVETKLVAASSTLESAKQKGEEAVTAFRAIDPAKFSEQKEAAFAARDLAAAARKLFIDAHKQLFSVLAELKKLSPRPSVTPANN